MSHSLNQPERRVVGGAGSWRVLSHTVCLMWIVSVVTFALVAAFDRRRIEPPAGKS